MDIKIPYKPRNWAKQFHGSTKRFLALCLHRRAGKTTALVNHLQRSAIDDKLERQRISTLAPNLSSTDLDSLMRERQYGLILPTYTQAKSVAWDMLKYFARDIPGIKTNESELFVRYPNGNKLRLFGADKPQSLRGFPLWGAGFDEFSQQPSNIFSEVLSKSLADHLGYSIFAGTIIGKNQLYRTYETAKSNPQDWFSMWKTIDDSLIEETGATVETLRIALEDDRKLVAQGIITQDEFDQEWYLSTAAAIKGAYYAREIASARAERRIGNVPFDPALPVHTVWDLGIGDATSIGFFQRIGPEIRMIDYYENADQPMTFYLKYIQDKPYSYGVHIGPHDLEVREYTSGKSRTEVAKSLGIQFLIAPNVAIDDGIHAMRLFWRRLWIDEEKCAIFLDYIAQYKRQWNAKRGMFEETPYHDFTSHAADMARYAALSEKLMSNQMTATMQQKKAERELLKQFDANRAGKDGGYFTGSPYLRR